MQEDPKSRGRYSSQRNSQRRQVVMVEIPILRRIRFKQSFVMAVISGHLKEMHQLEDETHGEGLVNVGQSERIFSDMLTQEEEIAVISVGPRAEKYDDEYSGNVKHF